MIITENENKRKNIPLQLQNLQEPFQDIAQAQQLKGNGSMAHVSHWPDTSRVQLCLSHMIL